MSLKVGDRVRVNNHCYLTKYIGREGEVASTPHSLSGITVRFDNGDQIRFYHSSLDKITDHIKPGMSSEDLASAVEDTIRACRERVTGVGDQQYSTAKGQKFEGLTVSELIGMAREEAQDLVVYATMTDIRLARIEAAIKGVGL